MRKKPSFANAQNFRWVASSAVCWRWGAHIGFFTTDASVRRDVGFVLVVHDRCRSGSLSHIAFRARGVSSPSTVESARRVLLSFLGLGQSPPSKPVILALSTRLVYAGFRSQYQKDQ